MSVTVPFHPPFPCGGIGSYARQQSVGGVGYLATDSRETNPVAHPSVFLQVRVNAMLAAGYSIASYTYNWCTTLRFWNKPCHATVWGACQENCVALAATTRISASRCTLFGMAAVGHKRRFPKLWYCDRARHNSKRSCWPRT